MVDYPAGKLDKALARRGASTTNRPLWQELLVRHDSVPSNALLAPPVIQGFQGSWAAQYALGNGQTSNQIAESPASIQRQANHLGQPGLPEINFRPYDWGTSRHGKYGPSLLGHPVSFEVVGPTSKSPFLHHQWRVNTTGSSDVLTLDSCTWRSTALAVETLTSTTLDTIPEIYGITTIPEEGLYLVITQTGGEGYLDADAGEGGLGDGVIGVDLAAIPGRLPIRTGNSGAEQRAKFEVFRVTGVTPTTLTLDSGKRLRTFFDVPAEPGNTPIIRAVMLVKPAAARLVAVPGSGAKGRETVFAFVPPAKALNSDLSPPALMWSNTGFKNFDPWLGYGTSATAGKAGLYPQNTALPIPRSLRSFKGRLQGIDGETPVAVNTGLLVLMLEAGSAFDAVEDIGKIVCLQNIQRVDDGDWSGSTVDGAPRIGDPQLDRLLGFWEIEDASPSVGVNGEDSYTVKMVTQVDPLTGVPFYGSAEFMQMATTGLVAGQEVRLQGTLHEPVSSLWTTPYPQIENLESARLQHLLDPSWVQPTLKNLEGSNAFALGRPDRAAFATGSSNAGVSGSNEDPGSLLDLGFRVVFYPAKTSLIDGSLVPDFHNPITSNEVILDATLSGEKQFLEVDYAAGLVYLSHPPRVGSQLAPNANILVNSTHNPRGEMVFFASFVPFSQEPGQRGASVRVTAGSSLTGPGGVCGSDAITESSDLYGSRIFWPATPAQTITSGPNQEIHLEVTLTPLDLPPTGFVEIVQGNNTPYGSPVWVDGANNRVSTFGYTQVIYSNIGNNSHTTLKGCFGGGVQGDAATPTALAPWTVVLRREVLSPNLPNGSVGTDYQMDTTFGNNKRSSVLRFKHGSLIAEADGSVTVDNRDPLTEANRELFKDLFSSWVLRGGEQIAAIPVVGGSELVFTELVVLIEGVRTVIPSQTVTVDMDFPGPPLPIYLYIDGSNPTCPVYATTDQLPLPNSSDVLLGRYTHTATDITAYQDLRRPLTDLDKRLDITVGDPDGFDQPGDAHFLTLADAVTYVSEITLPVAGDNGRYHRIKVIGPTTEDSANLPIKPMVPGLIIEGAGHSARTTKMAVSWGFLDASAPALFDLSGCHDLIIRDLVFEFVSNGPLAPSNVPRERCLFTCDERVDGVRLNNVLLENITLVGPAHGFLYVNDDIDPLTGLSQVTLRKCVAEELTDFAVFIGSTVPFTRDLQVEDCLFQVRKATDTPSPELTGIGAHEFQGVIHHSGAASSHIRVKQCRLLGGTTGVYFGGSFHTIEDTVIQDTDQSAIVVSGADIQINHVSAVTNHTEVTLTGYPGPAAPVRVGIVVLSTGERCSIKDSLVTVATPVAGDYALHIADNTTGPIVTVVNNTFGSAVRSGPYNVVNGNRITDELDLENFSRASDNIISEGTSTGNLSTQPSCHITGNQIAGNLVAGSTLTSFGNKINGVASFNIVGVSSTFTNDAFAAEVRLDNSSTSFTSCTFLEGVVAVTGKNPTNMIFDHCRFRLTADLELVCSGASFTGCVFSPLNGPWTFEVVGSQNKFNGNRFGAGFTVYMHDSPSTATNLSVVGNFINATTEGGMYIIGDDCTIVGNDIRGFEDQSADPGLYSLHIDGDNNTVSDNVFGAGLRVSGDGCLVANNQADDVLFEAPNSTYAGNLVSGDLSLASLALNSLLSQNKVGTATFLTATGCDVVGNVFGSGAITATAPSTMRFKDNYVGGSASFGNAGGSRIEMVGNHFAGSLTFAPTSYFQESTLSGNKFVGNVNLSNGGPSSLTNCTFNGNTCIGTFTCTNSTRTTFSGNRFADTVTLTTATQAVVQGNWVGNTAGASRNLVLSSSNDYICVGNFVTGSILVPTGGSAVTCGVIVGNHANLIGDGAGGVEPVNYQVTVGNKVAATGNVFNVAPATTSANDHNVLNDT